MTDKSLYNFLIIGSLQISGAELFDFLTVLKDMFVFLKSLQNVKWKRTEICFVMSTLSISAKSRHSFEDKNVSVTEKRSSFFQQKTTICTFMCNIFHVYISLQEKISRSNILFSRYLTQGLPTTVIATRNLSPSRRCRILFSMVNGFAQSGRWAPRVYCIFTAWVDVGFHF